MRAGGIYQTTSSRTVSYICFIEIKYNWIGHILDSMRFYAIFFSWIRKKSFEQHFVQSFPSTGQLVVENEQFSHV